MPDFRLADDSGPAIAFAGHQLARVTTWRMGKRRWSEFYVYRTCAGRVVLHKIVISTIPGEETRYKVWVFYTMDGLVDHLGLTRLSHKLYRMLGLAEVRIP